MFDVKDIGFERAIENVEIFESEEFGQVRTVVVEGKPYFVGRDIASSLGYKEPHKAIATHCKGGTKHPIGVVTGKKLDGSDAIQNIEMLIIPEGDIYRLIVRSQLPTAEKFESWVFDEVLPSIRKHGAYMTPQTIEETLSNPDFIIGLATKLKEEQQARSHAERQVKEMKPKALFADAVATSKSSVLVGELAKVLKQNNIDIGQNRMFEWLRSNTYLMSRKGESWNMPTQRSMDLELFEIKVRTIVNPDGSIRTTKTTKVTGKGQIYFVNKFSDLQQLKIVNA